MPINSRVTTGRRDGSAVAARRFRGDRGAILAEAALITPVFMFILFGVLEFGGAFRDYLTVNNATSTGGRQASIAANDPDADYQILQTIKREVNAMPLSQVERVVVYKATEPDTPVPTACKTAATGNSGSGPLATPSYDGACNVYTKAGGWSTLTAADFGCSGTSPDRFWCPTARKYTATGVNGPPDFVGVYVEVTHVYYTGMFGKNITLAKTTVFKIEPQSLK